MVASDWGRDLVGDGHELDAGSASELINALRGMAPQGKENPWNAILDSLVSLFDETAQNLRRDGAVPGLARHIPRPDENGPHRQDREPDAVHHADKKAGREMDQGLDGVSGKGPLPVAYL